MILIGVMILFFLFPISCIVGINSQSDVPMTISTLFLFAAVILIGGGALGGWWDHG